MPAVFLWPAFFILGDHKMGRGDDESSLLVFDPKFIEDENFLPCSGHAGYITVYSHRDVVNGLAIFVPC